MAVHGTDGKERGLRCSGQGKCGQIAGPDCGAYHQFERVALFFYIEGREEVEEASERVLCTHCVFHLFERPGAVDVHWEDCEV